jgi:hypothetical protein
MHDALHHVLTTVAASGAHLANMRPPGALLQDAELMPQHQDFQLQAAVAI